MSAVPSTDRISRDAPQQDVLQICDDFMVALRQTLSSVRLRVEQGTMTPGSWWNGGGEKERERARIIQRITELEHEVSVTVIGLHRTIAEQRAQGASMDWSMKSPPFRDVYGLYKQTMGEIFDVLEPAIANLRLEESDS